MTDHRLLLRVNEAADMLGVSRSKLYQLIAENQVPSVKLGASIRVPLESLRTWLSSKEKQQQPAA